MCERAWAGGGCTFVERRDGGRGSERAGRGAVQGLPLVEEGPGRDRRREGCGTGECREAMWGEGGRGGMRGRRSEAVAEAWSGGEKRAGGRGVSTGSDSSVTGQRGGALLNTASSVLRLTGLIRYPSTPLANAFFLSSAVASPVSASNFARWRSWSRRAGSGVDGSESVREWADRRAASIARIARVAERPSRTGIVRSTGGRRRGVSKGGGERGANEEASTH